MPKLPPSLRAETLRARVCSHLISLVDVGAELHQLDSEVPVALHDCVNERSEAIL
jgi:hypothetical protein